MNALDLLRCELSQRFPQASQVRWGQEGGDDLFWDWPKGVLRELVATPGAGASLLLQRWLKLGEGPQVLLDAADGFDPACCDEELLPQLLWFRCAALPQALQAADVLLREGSTRTLVMDFRLVEAAQLRAIASSSWHRLRLLSRRSGVSVLVCSPFAWLPCAQARWVLADAAFELSDLQQSCFTAVEQRLVAAQMVA